jgi:hypothetical protein
MTANENIIKALDAEAKEDVITNLLLYCFRESPAFREAFGPTVLGIMPHTYAEITPIPRIRTSRGVPDAAFLCRAGDSPPDLVILENKLNAEEGIEQTVRFSDDNCAAEIGKRYGIDAFAQIRRVFLALCEYQKPISPQFAVVTYREFLPALRQSLSSSRDTLASALAQDLASVLEEFYERALPRRHQILIDRLLDPEISRGLDAAPAYFINAFDRLTLPPGMERGDFGVFQMPGTKTAFVQYTTSHWRPATFYKRDGSDFNARRHFDIHFEVQFNGKTVALVLHHHTRPYVSSRIVANKWTTSAQREHERYLADRGAFYSRLEQYEPGDFRCKKRDLLLASARLTASRQTVQQIRTQVEALIAAAADCVERSVLETYGVAGAV